MVATQAHDLLLPVFHHVTTPLDLRWAGESIRGEETPW